MASDSFVVPKATFGLGVEDRLLVNELLFLKHLGSGGFAQVALAETTDSQKRVAVKVFNKPRLARLGGFARVQPLHQVEQEAFITRHLNDAPHCISIQSVVDDPERKDLLFVLDFADAGAAMEANEQVGRFYARFGDRVAELSDEEAERLRAVLAPPAAATAPQPAGDAGEKAAAAASDEKDAAAASDEKAAAAASDGKAAMASGDGGGKAATADGGEDAAAKAGEDGSGDRPPAGDENEAKATAGGASPAAGAEAEGQESGASGVGAAEKQPAAAAAPVDPSDLLPAGHLRVMSEPMAKQVAWDMLCALEECHARHVAHRDVKPSNLLAFADGRVVLGDFGVSHCFTQPAGDEVAAALRKAMSGVNGDPTAEQLEEAAKLLSKADEGRQRRQEAARKRAGSQEGEEAAAGARAARAWKPRPEKPGTKPPPPGTPPPTALQKALEANEASVAAASAGDGDENEGEDAPKAAAGGEAAAAASRPSTPAPDGDEPWVYDMQGARAFQPPEVAADMGAEADPEAEARFDAFKGDAWQAGVTLFCLLTGKVPFGSALDSDTDVLFASICKDEVVVPAWVGASPELQQVLAGLLTKDPAARMSVTEAKAHAWFGGGFDGEGGQKRKPFPPLAFHVLEDYMSPTLGALRQRKEAGYSGAAGKTRSGRAIGSRRRGKSGGVEDLGVVTTEAGVLQPPPSGVPITRGWLVKRGQRLATWRKRYFILRGSNLFYFRQEPAGDLAPKEFLEEAVGYINLSVITDVGKRPRRFKPFRFALAVPGRVLLLQAANEAEVGDWITTFSHLANQDEAAE